MKEKCFVCGSMVEDVSGICPVCGAALGRSTQVNSAEFNYNSVPMGQPQHAGTGEQVYYQNANIGTNNATYNYQSVASPLPRVAKKKLFGILSIVFAVIGMLTICVPVLSMICCIASIVFGIIALVKKQVKVPAIIGLVIGGISGLLCAGYLGLNLLMVVTVGTDIKGIFEQSFEVVQEGCTELSGVMIGNGNDIECIFLHTDGTYTTLDDVGYYRCVSYADEEIRYHLEDATLYAMKMGYRIKNVTAVELTSSTGDTEYYCFVVPEDYQPGDMIYYIKKTGTGETDYTLESVVTVELY